MTAGALYAVPHPGDDVPGLVTGALTEAGYRVADPAAGVAPGAVRVGWQRRAWAGSAELVAIVEVTGRWDLCLAAALSRGTGGFAVAREPGPAPRPEGAALLYAGQVLAAWGRDGGSGGGLRSGLGVLTGLAAAGDPPVAAEEDASGSLDRISVWSPAVLAQADVTGSGQLDAIPPATADPDRLPSPGRLVQVVLACDEQHLRGALATGTGGRPAGEWRWRASRTPEAAVPFVLLRGHSPVVTDWVTELAVRTGGYAAAVQFDGPDTGAPWLWATPGGELTSGVALTGVEVAEVWRDLAAVLGTLPATFTWPAADPGHALDAPG